MTEELKSLLTKELGLGIVIGLIIGIAVGYAVTPKVDITPFEQRISDLEGEVTDLQNDLENRSIQITDLQAQISERDSQISELESQIEDKDNQMAVLELQISEKESQAAALQNQMLQLQSQVRELEQLIPPYTKGEWNLVDSFQGISGVTTRYFYVGGTEIRLNWTWSSSVEKGAEFSILLYQQGQTIITEACLSLEEDGTTYVHNIEAASYYLKISEANLDQWNVTVEAWIPE